MFDIEDDYDSSTSDSDGGIWAQSAPATSAPQPATGPIGQQIGQKIAGGGTPANSTSTGNGSTVTSTGNGSVGSGYAVKSAYSTTPQVTWNTINSLAQPKPFTKTKVRYVIVQADLSTLELKEQPTITPQEMIGLSKFLGLVSTYTVLILGQAVINYNFNIKWSDIIANLGIQQHFVAGQALLHYDNDNSEVLDILLYDPA